MSSCRSLLPFAATPAAAAVYLRDPHNQFIKMQQQQQQLLQQQ